MYEAVSSTTVAAAVLPPQQRLYNDDDFGETERLRVLSHKRSATTSSPNSPDSNKKRGSILSLHEYVSTSETDGGVTTDAETKDSKNASGSSESRNVNESLALELSEDDRTRMNRDRNREHARNTRIRKKAYLEKLKATVENLCRERNLLVQDRATSASRLVEQQKLRVEVILGYFALRQRCERHRDLWAGLCEENLVCTLPVTPYRSFPASEVSISQSMRGICLTHVFHACIEWDAVLRVSPWTSIAINYRYNRLSVRELSLGSMLSLPIRLRFMLCLIPSLTTARSFI